MSDTKISAIAHILRAHEWQDRNTPDKLAFQVRQLRLKMMCDEPITIFINTEQGDRRTLELVHLERVSHFFTTVSIAGTDTYGKPVEETYGGVCSIKSI